MYILVYCEESLIAASDTDTTTSSVETTTLIDEYNPEKMRIRIPIVFLDYNAKEREEVMRQRYIERMELSSMPTDITTTVTVTEYPPLPPRE